MLINVNDYNVQGTHILRQYFKEIVDKAKTDEKLSKEVLIEFLESMLEDESCPISWEDGVIIRKNKQ